MVSIRANNRRGDTIVEVLIAILVVGTVLGGAYVAANRYFKNVRQAQEYTNALKIAEGQIEQIKAFIDNNDNSPKTTASGFCINDGVITTSNCTFDSLYTVNTSRSGGGSNGYVFTVSVTWASLTSTGNSSVQLTYMVYD